MRIAITTREDVFYLPRVFKFILNKYYNEVLFVLFRTRSIKIDGIIDRNSITGNILDFCDFYEDASYYNVFISKLIKKVYTTTNILNLNLLPSITKELNKKSISSYCVNSYNDNAVLELLKREKIDILLSIFTPQLLKEDILSIPNIACINLHDALLPQYRGLRASFWELYNNESQAGLTVHVMNKFFDDGDILKQKKIKIDTNSMHKLNLIKSRIAGELIFNAIEDIKLNGIVGKTNNKKEGSYFPPPNKYDYLLYKKKGLKIW